MYVKKHYVYVQSGVILSLLHYSCDSMRLLCVVWCVGKRPACFVVSKREKLSFVWQVLPLWGVGGGDRWGECSLSWGWGFVLSGGLVYLVWARLGDALFGLLGFLVWYRKPRWVICCGHGLVGYH